MASSRADRRLAAILAADVAGYSALVERDESSTLARLAALRSKVVEPSLALHRGRPVKLMGDGLLAEFPSVVDAIACAVAVQTHPAADLPVRIGVNLGDVVVEGDDLMGDGVNIAARLEGLAKPGGIVVSGTAWDHLHGQTGLAFESLGERQLKNIARPVRAYRVVTHPTVLPTAPAKTPERPSIAVLPFDNLSGDPAQSYFSDGMTEDPITELSRFRDLRVVARHSSFSFRNQCLDAEEIGRRLGVRYLVEGSVRRAGERVRVTAQLIEVADGAHLWADRYDRALDDIFAVQDEVVAKTAATLMGRIEAAHLSQVPRVPTADLAAYDLVLQRIDRLAAYGPGTNAEARHLFERAIARDPSYALAHAFVALAIFNQDWQREPDASLERCLAYAQRAVDLGPHDSRCARILALALLTAREFERAELHSVRSLVLNPNDAHAAAYRAHLLYCTGRAEEGLAMIRKAIDLNPYHPLFYWYTLGRALQAVGRYGEAIVAWSNLTELRFHHQARLAVCHAKLGQVEAARQCVRRTMALRPDFSSGAWVTTLPYRHEADRRQLLDDLLAAGLPP